MFFRSSKTTPVKSPVREKVVALYDEVFFVCDDGKERVLINTDEFWEQLLLLKINVSELTTRLGKVTNVGIGLTILKKCASVTKSSIASGEIVRSINGLSTASIVIRCLGYPNKLIKEADESAIVESLSVLTNCSFSLLSDESMPMLCKRAAFAWLTCLLASDEKLGTNSHILMAFEALESAHEGMALQSVMGLLSNPATRFQFGVEAVTLFSLLIQLPGNENQIPARFSIFDDEAAINAMSQIIDGELSNCNLVWRDRLRQQQSKGIWSSFSSAIAGLLVGGDDQPLSTTLQPGLLLAFFYATILNRHFLPTLTQTYPITASPPSSHAKVSQENSAAITSEQVNSNSDHVTPKKISSNVIESVAIDENGLLSTPRSNVDTAVTPVSVMESPAPEHHQLPGNLLLTVIEYTSAILQDIREEIRRNAAHTCLMALEAIAEDPYANSVLHDDNLAFRPIIHRVQLRHRRAQGQPVPPRPLAAALLELANEFICTHLMKNFPFDLHYHALSIVHRLLCFQKKSGIRLKFDWHELWSALTALLRFLSTNESILIPKAASPDKSQKCTAQANVFSLVHLAVTIFNMFITFGDAILSDPLSYDDLYYEIIRNADLFASVYQLCLRTCSSPESLSPSASRAMISKPQSPDQDSGIAPANNATADTVSINSLNKSDYPAQSTRGDSSPGAARAASVLHNIRAIIAHYSPLVDDLNEKKGASFVTEQDILELVRCHYDSLLLRLIEGTDSFDRFRGQALAPMACRASLQALGDAQLSEIRRVYSCNSPPIPNTDTLVNLSH